VVREALGLSPTIPGNRFCEICGSLLKSYQLRFCSVPHSLEWLHNDRAANKRKAEVLSSMMAEGEIPKPPRATGPFKHADPDSARPCVSSRGAVVSPIYRPTSAISSAPTTARTSGR
jgi:hypothetical protein